MEPFRVKVVIATKFGFEVNPEDGKWTKLNSRLEHIRAVAEASLTRLKVDALDLFYQLCVDLNVPIEETADAVKLLPSTLLTQLIKLQTTRVSPAPRFALVCARAGPLRPDPAHSMLEQQMARELRFVAPSSGAA